MLGGLGLFAGLIYASNPRLVWQELKAVGAWGFLTVVANEALSFLAWVLSWSILLRGAGIFLPWKKVLSPMLAAAAVTYLTPSAYFGGEPVRVYWVAKETGRSLAHVTATVVVERLFAGASLLAFAGIGGFFAFLSPTLSLTDKGAMGLGFVLMAAFLALGVVSFTGHRQWLSRSLRALGRLIPWRGTLARLSVSAAEMENQIHQVFSRCPGHALIALVLQLVTVFLHYIRPQVFLHFTNQPLFGFSQLSLFFTLNVFIGAFLWLTPGGLGLADGGRVGVFKLLGISLPSAFAYSILFRFVEFIRVGIGLYLLMQQGLLHWRSGRLAVPIERKRHSG